MQINTVRLREGEVVREPIDTTMIISVEFVLADGHTIEVMPAASGGVHVYSGTGRLRIVPDTANTLVIEAVRYSATRGVVT
jgi:hypothetical protein